MSLDVLFVLSTFTEETHTPLTPDFSTSLNGFRVSLNNHLVSDLKSRELTSDKRDKT